MAIRHHSFCELYKTNLCQFCSLRIALKMCSHSNYLFQRCSLKNEVRGKGLKQLYPTKASFMSTFPASTVLMYAKKKKSLEKALRNLYFYVLLPILGLKIQSIIFTYLYLNESFSKRLRESWMPLTVGPAVHHIPAVNSVGHSSVSVLYCLLAHSHQDMKIKERDKSQQSQPNLNGKKKI